MPALDPVPRWVRAATVLCLCAASARCGGGQTQGTAFDEVWRDDTGESARELARRLEASSVPYGTPVVIGIVGQNALAGMPLDGGKAWRFSHPLDSRPVITGSVIAGKGAGEIFLLEGRTGRLLWTRPAGGMLRGAGDDGKITVVSLKSTTGQGSIVLAIQRDGSVIRQVEDAAEIGTPAVTGDLAWLPWQGRFVTAYDLLEGEEVSRLTLPREMSRVFAQDGAIFLGGEGATRLRDWIGTGGKPSGSIVTLPSRGLPGSPRWMRRGTAITPVAADASDTARLFARLLPDGVPAIDGNRFAATYQRLVFGLDAHTAALLWIHIHDAPIFGGSAYRGGFALCDASGKVTFLDRDNGTVVGSLSLGTRTVACVVQTDALKRPSGPPAPPLLAQIQRVLRLTDPSLAPAQEFLLHELGKMRHEHATRILIELVTGRLLAPSLLAAAERALSARRSGTERMPAGHRKRRRLHRGCLDPAGRQ